MSAVIDDALALRALKELVRLVIIGSVDDGKSTLIGRLLYETGALYDDQIEHVRRVTRNGDAIDFSLFTDGLKAEREQGITIDVAYRYFETARRKFILADTPGHAQYTRNMATGASTADAGIILVDARLGVLPQTRRHATIAALLGIRRLAVAVNKMDLVGFDESTFARVARELGEFAGPLGFETLSFFPVSARLGDNVAQASARTPWHQGGTILGFLDAVEAAREDARAPFRFPVQLVLRPNLDYRGLAGQIASGSIAVGDEVVVLPSEARSRIRSIDTFEGSLSQVSAPMSVVLRLSDEVDAGRGDLLAHAASAPAVLTQVEANVVWLGARPLDPRRAYSIKHTTRTAPAQIESVRHRLDPETLAREPADTLALNDIGRITVRCARPLVCELYANNHVTGAFILIDALTNETAAAATIVDSSPAPDRAEGVGRSARVATLDDLVERDKNHDCPGYGAGRVCIRVEAVADLPSRFGQFRIVAFRNNRDGKEHVAMVHGDVIGAEDVPTRLHSECLTGDVMGSLRCDCRDQLEVALQHLGSMPRGLLLYLRQEGRGIGGFRDDERDYSIATHMLASLNVGSVRLMTNDPKKVRQLEQRGIRISGRLPMISSAS
ncbi:MAG: sulfate adenylyltransferase [Deltaproteobacteria bacterium]|nr:MAG: sulfate adenylyltransferase [Deltaproteobacteria bacterium]